MMKKSLVVCAILLVLFASSVSAAAKPGLENLAQTDVIRLMSEIEPFMSLQKDYTVKFDKLYATQNGLSPEAVGFATEYVKFHNNTMKSVMEKGIYGATIDPRIKIFAPFFEKVRDTGIISASKLYSSSIQTKGSKQARASQSVILFDFPSKSKTISLGTACGGGFEKPHYCPEWNWSSPYYSSYANVKKVLLSMGFHNTYPPGCVPGVSNCAYDFTKWVSAYGCSSSSGAMRMQRITYQTGSNMWRYKTQTPEPNPEIKSYSWPAYWWGPYVIWWHVAYC